jgi:hypothetical protein
MLDVLENVNLNKITMILDHISTLDEIEKEALEIYAFLQINCSEDGSEAAIRGDQLNVYMSRSGKLLADTRYWQDVAMHTNTLLVNETYKSMPPTTRNNLIKSMRQRENYMSTWIERINRTCTHQQQFMITLISKAKTEMQMAGYTGNGPKW